MQPAEPSARSLGVRTAPCQEGTKGEKNMPDDLIRRMIRAAIESFPISEEKKADILRNILGEKR